MKERIEKTVFISYRRTNVSWALAIYQNLTQQGFDVFFDYKGIAGGDFERAILENIRARAHFVALLTPSALERCGDPADWLRREIETALDTRRNFVPIMLDGFNFDNPIIASQLTGKLTAVKSYNALRITPDYFDEGMRRLRDLYLSIPLTGVLHSVSSDARRAATEQKKAAEAAHKVQERDLISQQLPERAAEFSSHAEQERILNEKIDLKRDDDEASGTTGNAPEHKAGYKEPICLTPELSRTSNRRGVDKWAFLWITDIHYESPESDFADDRLGESTYTDFHSMLDFDFHCFSEVASAGGLSFIAVGGDVTTHMKVEGFVRFLTEAFPRLNAMVDRPEAICIVPGEHDVQWSGDPTAPGYFTKKFKHFSDMVSRCNASSCLLPKGELHKEQLHKEGKLNFDFPKNGPLYIDRVRKVVVLNLNSSMRCGELNLKMLSDLHEVWPAVKADRGKVQPNGPGVLEDIDPRLWRYLIRNVAHVTQAQITILGERIKIAKKELQEAKEDWASYLRVALMHHHLTPFPRQATEHGGSEATVDSSKVLSLLTSHGFDMVLTGHKHQAFQMPYHFEGKEILIIGGPTVGGIASNANFRGFHLVEVAANHQGKAISVREVQCLAAQEDDIEGEMRKTDPKRHTVPPTYGDGGTGG